MGSTDIKNKTSLCDSCKHCTMVSPSIRFCIMEFYPSDNRTRCKFYVRVKGIRENENKKR
jgi:hypothetical protein